MMPRYAQINADNIAFAISDLSGSVDAPDMIPLEDGQDVMGMRWAGSAWVAGPAAPIFAMTVLTYKADVWRRATDAQASVIDTELQKLDVRRRRMWDDASYLDHSDDMVVFFKTMLTQTFGAAEADRILAPSNV